MLIYIDKTILCIIVTTIFTGTYILINSDIYRQQTVLNDIDR